MKKIILIHVSFFIICCLLLLVDYSDVIFNEVPCISSYIERFFV